MHYLTALKKYRETGEISSGLSRDAAMAVHSAERSWQGIRSDYVEIEKLYIDDYRKIANEVHEVHLKMKVFEFKHWMGFCDADVAELLQLYCEWESHFWDGSNPSRETMMRNLWDPWGEEEKKIWNPYFSRRVREPLQKTMDTYNGWGSAETTKMKVMLGASAGRVLLTLQDRFAQHHPESIYGGAWISLIFDESSPNPRGGIQGHCATKNEAVALIQSVIDDMPTLKHDSGISMG